MSRAIIPCACMTCGVRNDFSNPDGLCQNGHDDWLEYRDVIAKNEWFEKMIKLTGLDADMVTTMFMASKPFIIK